jgi:HSP20 family protein
MAKKESKEIAVQEQQEIKTEDMERTRERVCFVPKTDIYETAEEIVIVADIPGVNKKSVDVSIENQILTINAYSSSTIPSGYDLVFGEYAPGDFQRTFRITSDVDHEKIKATVNQGELLIKIPKAEKAKVKKIPIEVG